MDFIAFDLETTGLSSGINQITEVGAIKYKNGKPDSLFCTLVNPQQSIPPEASKVTGITDDMVRDKPSIDKLLDPFTQFCAGLPLFAYNASFDFQFLAADIKKHKSSAPKGPVVDILALCRSTFKGLPNYKLGTMADHLKIKDEGSFHRAGADAYYCAEVLLHVFRKHFNSLEEISVEKVLKISGRNPVFLPQVEDRQETLFNL